MDLRNKGAFRQGEHGPSWPRSPRSIPSAFAYEILQHLVCSAVPFGSAARVSGQLRKSHLHPGSGSAPCPRAQSLGPGDAGL